MEKAAAHLEGAPPTEASSSRAEGEDAGLDAAMSKAEAHLNGGSTDAE